jgi:uncharacterized protein (UPF0212 family)
MASDAIRLDDGQVHSAEGLAMIEWYGWWCNLLGYTSCYYIPDETRSVFWAASGALAMSVAIIAIELGVHFIRRLRHKIQAARKRVHEAALEKADLRYMNITRTLTK